MALSEQARSHDAAVRDALRREADDILRRQVQIDRSLSSSSSSGSGALAGLLLLGGAFLAYRRRKP